MKCLAGPLYLEILKEELRLCRCKLSRITSHAAMLPILTYRE